MKKIFTFVAFFSIAAYAGVILVNKGPSSINDEAVVKINGTKIYKSQILQKISEVFAANGSNIDESLRIENLPPQIIETFAKEIYLESNLVKNAKKANVQKDPEVKRAIEQQESKILIDAYLDHVIKEKVSDDAVKEKYAELTGNLEGKKEYNISHIVVADEETAKTIYNSYKETASAQKAKKFDELVKKYSIDKESSKNKGNLGYILEDNIIKEISDVVFKMKKGEYSQPIKSSFGWHIILLEDIRDAKTYVFEDVKDNIKEQMIKEETKKIYDDIFQGAKIKILIKDKKEAPKKSVENEEKK